MFFTLLISILSFSLGGGLGFSTIRFDDSQEVYCMGQDSDGIMWVGTDQGLFFYDGYRAVPTFGKGEWSNIRINTLCTYSGKVCLGTENGVVSYDPAAREYSYPEGMPSDVRASLHTDKGILLGARDGVYIYGGEGSTPEKLTDVSSNVYSLLERGDSLFVGTMRGLYLFCGEKLVEIKYEGKRLSLVNALCEDPSGGVLVGTEGALFVYGRGNLREDGRFRGHSVKTMEVSPRGLFVGTDDGLFLVEKDGLSRIVHDSRVSSSVSSNVIWSLLCDSWGNVWVGTDNAVSLLWENPPYRFVPMDEMTGSGMGNNIQCILEDTHKRLWMGGSNGLVCMDANQSIWFRQGSEHPLPHNRIRNIFEDDEGDIFLCTDHGICLYDAGEERFRNYILTDSTAEYSSAWAYDIVKDKSGMLWVSSYMGGVFAIEKSRLISSPKGEVVASRHVRSSLESPNVGDLIIDGDGMLWASLYGVASARIDPVSLSITHYPSDAMPSGKLKEKVSHLYPAIRFNCAYSPADSSLVYLGADDGIYVLDPESLSGGHVSALHVSDVNVYGGNNATILLSDIPYGNNHPSAYMYRLARVDSKWQRLGPDMQIRYNGLRPGKYRLDVAPSDYKDNVDFSMTQRVDFRIKAPWYFSWWMKIIYVLAAAGIALLLRRLYVVRQRLKKELETSKLAVKYSLSGAKSERDDEKFMLDLKAIVEDNLSDPSFNVQGLQEKIGMGDKSLYRRVKQLTGLSPVGFIRDLRMKKAALLLRENKLSVGEIMYLCGFTSAGYFSKCFKEAFGQTPAAYAKENLGKKG